MIGYNAAAEAGIEQVLDTAPSIISILAPYNGQTFITDSINMLIFGIFGDGFYICYYFYGYIFTIALFVALMVGTGWGSIVNKPSKYWQKLDEIAREFLKAGVKSVYPEAEEKIMSVLFREEEKVKELNDKGELKTLMIAGAIIFFAIALEFIPYYDEIYLGINPLGFLIALAFFSMIAEIGHDQALKFSLRSIGARSIFELSLMGILITIVSGILSFPILAAGSTRVLHKFENSRKEALVVSSGSMFNLTLGIFFLLVGIFMNAIWFALAGAIPNLANAVFSLFPTYPFEGRWVFRGSKGIWGVMFFVSMILYLSVFFYLTDFGWNRFFTLLLSSHFDCFGFTEGI